MDTWTEYKRMLDEKRKRKNQERERNDNCDFIMPLMAGYIAANAFNDNHNDNYNDYSDNSYDSSNDCMNMDFFDIF